MVNLQETMKVSVLCQYKLSEFFFFFKKKKKEEEEEERNEVEPWNFNFKLLH